MVTGTALLLCVMLSSTAMASWIDRWPRENALVLSSTASSNCAVTFQAGMVVSIQGGRFARLGGGFWCVDHDNITGVVCNQQCGRFGSGGAFTLVPGQDPGGVPNTWALRSGRTNLYCADEGDAKLSCNRANIGPLERFTFKCLGGMTYAIEAGYRRKYCSDTPTAIQCTRDTVGPWERFQITVQKGTQCLNLNAASTYTIQGGRENKFCVENNGVVQCNQDTASGSAGLFNLVSQGSPIYTIKSVGANKFCTDSSGTELTCNRESAEQFEKFTLECLSGNKFGIRGGSLNKWCSDRPGIQCNRDTIGAWEVFTLTAATQQADVVDTSENAQTSGADWMTDFLV